MSTPEPWQLVAEGYAAEASLVMAPFSLRAIELLAPGPEARVLDVAAGPGTLSIRLAPHVREVTAVDFSQRMLAQLEAAAHAAKLVNLRPIFGDGQNLPFAEAEFDAAFSIFGLMFFPDRARGFQELLRVLKPGAGAVVSSWAPLQDSSLLRAMFGALAAADPTFVMPVRNPAGLENPDVLAAEMSAGGFDRVRIEPMTLTIRPADAEDLWARMARSSAPLVMMRNRLGETEWQRREPTVRQFLAEVLAREPELATTAWLAVGYKP
jgi:ubiquinone/menaquinone biosynthesis C-methylase UbiE